ncbi:aminoglycoside phosphotransferase family protein [Paludibacter sp.]
MKDIINQFKLDTEIVNITPLKIGHINDSFILTGKNSDDESYFLQRINHNIFKNIDGLQNNIRIVTDHVRKKLKESGIKNLEQRVLQLVEAKDGKLYHKDLDGNYWRVYINIKNTHSFDTITPELAYETGKAFGDFHNMIADIPSDLLIDSIPNFHNVEFRVQQMKDAASENPKGRLQKTTWMMDELLRRADEMCYPQKLMREGKLPGRINHCDTKINNILFNEKNEPCCIVDLDTMMISTVLSDFGDFMRTAANTGAEDDENLENIDVNLDIYEAYTKGYLEKAKFLTELELDNLALGAKMLAYMQTVRFYTDYLNGDTYYKIQHPEHNWQRTLAQFRLLEQQEKKFDILRDIVKNYSTIKQ